ncbi:hypothetical protein L7F22_002756 [Adiantum nelumboides]|nr:hypothetical protein [Adiantum nelumboides]
METSLKTSLHDVSDLAHVTLYQTAVGCLIYVCTQGYIFSLQSVRSNLLWPFLEAAYKVVFTATIECVWLRRLMAYFGVGQDTANTIYTDSQSALAIARNPNFQAHTKHIEVHYHYVRERFSAGEISLAYVPTQNNLANLFTKALSREKLEAFHKALGLLPFMD